MNSTFLGKSSSYLIKVNLRMINNERCNWFYWTAPKRQLANGIIPDIQICAGGNDGKDTCQVSWPFH